MLADFDIFEHIERNTNNIIYSGYFTEDLIYTENFIKYKEKNYEQIYYRFKWAYREYAF